MSTTRKRVEALRKCFAVLDALEATTDEQRDAWQATREALGLVDSQRQQAEAVAYTSERHFALRDGYEHRAEEDYFCARPKFEDTISTRTAFSAGYVRGFDKATELAEGRASAPAPVEQAEPANIRERWNIERDGDGLLVCFNEHEKGQGCRYQRFVPESAAQPAAGGVPEGYALVPVEPTPEMLAAGYDGFQNLEDAWAAMLAAAPQAGGGDGND